MILTKMRKNSIKMSQKDTAILRNMLVAALSCEVDSIDVCPGEIVWQTAIGDSQKVVAV